MKNLSLILSSLALAGVAILLFLRFKESGNGEKKIGISTKSEGHTHGQIGYFEMDSLEQHYDYIKEVRSQLKRQEDEINAELNGMKKSYMGRIQQLQQKASTMSQQEGESAQAEINQMQMNLQQQEAKLSQELQEKQFKMMQEINNKIAEFLKGYNENKHFAYIISHSPGDFVYYSDSAFNITTDLIKGLNSSYKK